MALAGIGSRGTWVAALLSRGAPPSSRVRETQATGDSSPATLEFERFFITYEARITGYLWRMAGGADIAADLCQETFVRAWQHFDEVQQAAHPTAWLFRVATNLALNALRAQRNGVQAAMPLDSAEDPASSDPGRRVAEQELVHKSLQSLTPRARALLILREVYELEFEQIAATLGMPAGAVRMALSRARVQFRDRYLFLEDR